MFASNCGTMMLIKIGKSKKEMQGDIKCATAAVLPEEIKCLTKNCWFILLLIDFNCFLKAFIQHFHYIFYTYLITVKQIGRYLYIFYK